jgi:membrane protease YdiL (CAAX protease family)
MSKRERGTNMKHDLVVAWQRLAKVGMIQGLILVLSIVLAVGALGVRGQLTDIFPRQYRVPLEAVGPGASPPHAVAAALGRACSACEIELEDGELIISGPPNELNIGLVLSTLERHGFRWTRFSLGRDFGLVHAGAAITRAENLAWLLLPLPVLFLLGGWILRMKTGNGGLATVARNGFPLWRVVGVGIGGGLVLAAGIAGLQELLSHFGLPIVEQPWIVALAETGGAPRILLLLSAAVAAPIGEEVFFRGWMLPYLGRLGLPSAVVVSSACFAAMHFHLPGLALYFIFGVGLAVLYLSTRSLLAPILAHAVNNLIAVTLLLAGG